MTDPSHIIETKSIIVSNNSFSMSHSSSFKGRPVYLNVQFWIGFYVQVYDLIESNDFLYGIWLFWLQRVGVGLGILHSGVVVDGKMCI